MRYMRRATGPVTVAEFQAMPDDDAYRFELVRGAVVREPRPGARHSHLVGELFLRVSDHVRSNEFGIVLVDTGFRLPGEPATVRGPDLAFVAAARLPETTPTGFWEFAPDLAVEIVSPHDRWTSVQDRAFDYLDAGTREVWLIDPQAERATIHRSRADSRVLDAHEALEGSEVLPAFRLNLAELFATTKLR